MPIGIARAVMRKRRALFQEQWTGADGSAWNATRWPSVENDGATVDILSNQGRISAPANYTWGRARTSMTFSNFNLTAQFTRSATGEQYPFINFRASTSWEGSLVPQNGYELSFWTAFGGSPSLLELAKRIGGAQTVLGTPVSKSWETSPWNVRILAVGSSIKIRVWQGAEPGIWDFDVTDASHSSGVISFAHSSGDVGTGTKTILWDNLMVVAA